MKVSEWSNHESLSKWAGQIIATKPPRSPATHKDPKSDHDFHFNANNANYSRTSSNFNTLRKKGIRLAWRLNGCKKKWCLGSIVGKSRITLDCQMVCLKKFVESLPPKGLGKFAPIWRTDISFQVQWFNHRVDSLHSAWKNDPGPPR